MKKILILVILLLLPAIAMAEEGVSHHFEEWTMSTGVGQTFGGIHGFNVSYRFNRIDTGLSLAMYDYEEGVIGWAAPTKIYLNASDPSSAYFCFGPGTLLFQDAETGLFLLVGFKAQIRQSRWFIDANAGMGLSRDKVAPTGSLAIITFFQWPPAMVF